MHRITVNAQKNRIIDTQNVPSCNALRPISRFKRDAEYRHNSILGVAMMGAGAANQATYAFSLAETLAELYGTPLHEVHLAFVEEMLLSPPSNGTATLDGRVMDRLLRKRGAVVSAEMQLCVPIFADGHISVQHDEYPSSAVVQAMCRACTAVRSQSITVCNVGKSLR